MTSRTPSEGEQEILVGNHLFRWEPPDIGYVRYEGDLDGPTSLELSERSRVFTLGQPCVFLLVDLSRLGKISAEARRQSAQGGKDLKLRGVAVVSASAAMRVIVGLVSRAIDLMNGNTDNPTRLFETEQDARAWIAMRRAAVKR